MNCDINTGEDYLGKHHLYTYESSRLVLFSTWYHFVQSMNLH